MDDRPTVTETDRGGVYEMDRQTNRQKKGNNSFSYPKGKKSLGQRPKPSARPYLLVLFKNTDNIF